MAPANNRRVLPTSRSPDLATFTVASDGEELPRTSNLIAISITNDINRIPMARLIFKDGDPASGDFPLSNSDLLIPGKTIEIHAGYHNDNELIFSGQVVKQSIRANNASQAQLIIECKDKVYAMSIGRNNRYFTDSADSEIIEELLASHGLSAEIETTRPALPSVVQYNASDWDFMLTRAQSNSLFVMIDNGNIRIESPDFSQPPVVTLTYGANLLSFSASLDASFQQDEINTRSWVPADQAVSQSDASAAQIPSAGNMTPDDLSGLVSNSQQHFNHSGHLLNEERQAWADSRKLHHELSMFRGIASCTGLSSIKPGVIVDLAGVGERFSGNLYVTGVHHELGQGEWQMSVQFGIDPGLYASKDEVTELPAAGLLPAINGLQIGVVSQLQDDPEGEHRILVKMPLVDDEAEGTWARVASLDAGQNRGSFFRPEIGDEVILGFINQDPRHPLVLGMLNSSAKPAPVEASDDNPEKGFYSREALKLVFNDELKSVRIDTPAGNVVQLSEDEGAILIEDENGNKLELNSDGITINSSADLTLKASGDINIDGNHVSLSASGNFSAEGSSGAKLSSSATTNIKGSLVNIN